MQLDYQGERLARGLDGKLRTERQKLARLAASLDALSPLKVLGRGYSIAMNEDEQILTSVQDVACGQTVKLCLQDGTLKCRVEERMCQPWQEEKK